MKLHKVIVRMRASSRPFSSVHDATTPKKWFFVKIYLQNVISKFLCLKKCCIIGSKQRMSFLQISDMKSLNRKSQSKCQSSEKSTRIHHSITQTRFLSQTLPGHRTFNVRSLSQVLLKEYRANIISRDQHKSSLDLWRRHVR